MTQAASPATVLGTFDDVTLETRGFRWTLERRGDEFWVQMPDPLWFENPVWLMQALDPAWPATPPTIEARVVMTTGSHHMQNYWVRRPAGEGAALTPDDGSLIEVPWVWLIDEGRWVPNQDSFLTPPDSSLGGVARWNANCSQCHSVATEPGASPTYDEFDTRSVELGIACEACHGPAEAHVTHYSSPWRRYVQHWRRARNPELVDPTIVNPARLDSRRSVEVCAQCHSFGAWLDEEQYRRSGIPYRAGEELGAHRATLRHAQDTAEPALLDMLAGDSLALEGRFWRDGTNRVTGREYNGLIESTHADTDLTCLSCHSMHTYAAPADQLQADVSEDESCVACHDDFSADVTSHTRHDAGSSGSACMNCHMPRTTYGLFAAMRSHRIDSPSVDVSAENGKPNACNLCHLDRTLEWTGRYLTEWYGQPAVGLDIEHRSIAAGALWSLKGDAALRTIVGWHFGWQPAREASGDAWMAPYLAQLLADPYSATRRVAHRSIATLPGLEGFAYDYVAAPETLGRKADEALERWRRQLMPFGARPEILMGDEGNIYLELWQRLLAERDVRPLTIRE
jgi:hypothetical protein